MNWEGSVTGTKTVNFDSNVWKCAQDGNKLTFESPEYGKFVIQLFEWGGYSADFDSTAIDALRLGYYYADGGNNSFARDFSKQETKDFWAQYGIKID